MTDRTAANGGLRLVQEPTLNTLVWMAVATLDDGTEIRMRNLGDRVEVRTWDPTGSCRPPMIEVDPLAGRHVIDVRVTPPYPPARCCDLHGPNCEPIEELCCSECTEVAHPQHRDGSTCSNPHVTTPPSSVAP